MKKDALSPSSDVFLGGADPHIETLPFNMILLAFGYIHVLLAAIA